MRLPLLLAAVIGLFIAVTFWPARSLPFSSYDDTVHITQNPFFSPPTAEHVWFFWRYPFNPTRPVDVPTPAPGEEPPYTMLYAPLSFSVWALTALLAHDGATGPGRPWTFDPAFFHTLNLALHLANALLVLALLRKLTGNDWGAWAGALLFAVHPTTVEPVAWCTGMNTLLSTCLGLGAMLVYLRSIPGYDVVAGGYPNSQGIAPGGDGTPRPYEGSTSPNRWFYYVSCLLFLLAILAKPYVAAVPVMVLLFLWAMGEREWRLRLLELAPWFAFSAIDAWISTQRMHSDVQRSASIAVAPWLRPVLYLDSLTIYLRTVILPLNLAPDYGRQPHWVLAQPLTLVRWILPVVVTLALIYWVRRNPRPRARLALAGWAVFCLVLAPTSGLVPFYFNFTSLTADRYLYLALLGPALWVALAVSRFTESPSISPDSLRTQDQKGTVLAVTAVALVFSILSFHQISYWVDDQSLWGHTLEVNPRSPGAYQVLVSDLMNQGRNQAAQDLYRVGLQYNPDDGELLARAGENERVLGNVAAAGDYLRRSLQISPKNPNAHLRLGLVYLDQGRARDAFLQFWAGLKVDPNDPYLLFNYGLAAGKLGHPEIAAKFISEAIGQGYDPGGGYLVLGNALGQEGRFDDALRYWKLAIQARPDLYQAYDNMGMVLAGRGDLTGAEVQFSNTIQVNAVYTRAYLQLAQVLLKENRKSDAAKILQQGLAIQPNWPEAKQMLAQTR